MSNRRSVTICREGWYYLLVLAFILVGVVFRQVNLLIVLSGLMIGLFLLNWRISVYTLRCIDVQRRLPASVCAGDSVVVQIDLFNRRKRLAGWALWIHDRVTSEAGGANRSTLGHAQAGGYVSTVSMLAPQVEAGGKTHVNYDCTFSRRGKYRFGPIVVSTGFPLGLISCSSTINCTDGLLVRPSLGKLTTRWTDLLYGGRQGQHRSKHYKGLTEGEFYGMRDWRAGDSKRWIHWRTSAKLGQLTVRQFEEQRNQDVVLIIDLWKPPSASDQETLAVELAVSFAATIVADLCRRGESHLCVTVVGRRREDYRGAAGGVMLDHILDELAVVDAGTGEDTYQVVEEIASRTPSQARLIVISTRKSVVGTKELNSANGTTKSNFDPADPGAQNGAQNGAGAIHQAIWIDVHDELIPDLFHYSPPTESRSLLTSQTTPLTTRHSNVH